MIIKTEKYMIMSKGHPLKFYFGEGQMIDDFEEVFLFSKKTEAENELSTFDEPDNYKIVEVDTAYEF